MIKKLPLLAIVVVASVSALAQASFKDNPGAAYYTGGVGVTASVEGGGYIHLFTGGLLPVLPNGARFSGGRFNYAVPKLGMGWARNFSGTVVQTSATTYELSATFSGMNTDGLPFTGNTKQLFALELDQAGKFSLVSKGGTTEVKVLD